MAPRAPSPTGSVAGSSRHGPASTIVASQRHLKVPLPDTFEGKRNKLKAFLTQVDLYHAFNGDLFVNDTAKVLWTTTFLRGSAFDWIETFVVDHFSKLNRLTDREDETIAILDNYNEFKKRINRLFGDIDAERTAERHLQNLRQLKATATYAAEFQQYAGRTDWDDSALTAQYYRGLKDAVKDDIVRGERPQNLQDMISVSIRIDNRLHERNLERKGHYSRSGGKGKHKGRWPEAMELDAVSKEPSKAEMDRRREKGLCFKCGKEGHRASFHNKKHHKNKGPRKQRVDTIGRGGYCNSREPRMEISMVDRSKGKEKARARKVRDWEKEIKETQHDPLDDELNAIHTQPEEEWEKIEDFPTELPVPPIPDEDQTMVGYQASMPTREQLQKEKTELEGRLRSIQRQLVFLNGQDAKQGGNVADAKHPRHASLVWSSCYTDNCGFHYDAKINANRFPTKKIPIFWDPVCDWPDYSRKYGTKAEERQESLNW
jgi:hypothetical protein